LGDVELSAEIGGPVAGVDVVVEFYQRVGGVEVEELEMVWWL
jgi:hypothetical protein